MTRLLILTDWFYPAYKAGGPIRSTVNLAKLLQHDTQVYVLTSDRDLGDESAFSGIQQNTWLPFDKNIRVMYLDKKHRKQNHLKSIIEALTPSAIYLNSMFSIPFTIRPLLLNRSCRWNSKLVLAPRGMLNPSAIKIKKLKKSLFLKWLNYKGYCKNVLFHATTAQEKNEIHTVFGDDARVNIIPNVPFIQSEAIHSLAKTKRELNLVFVGRVHPIKNLHLVLNALLSIRSPVQLSIIGPVEDSDYHSSCVAIIKQLNPAVKVNWLGALPHDKTVEQLKAHHFFILPTQGENFGHAIFESFTVGRPVIISDKTPWRKLQKKNIGWDISLQHPENFTKAIQTAIDMDQNTFDAMCNASYRFANRYVEAQDMKKRYLEMFGT